MCVKLHFRDLNIDLYLPHSTSIYSNSINVTFIEHREAYKQTYLRKWAKPIYAMHYGPGPKSIVVTHDANKSYPTKLTKLGPFQHKRVWT